MKEAMENNAVEKRADTSAGLSRRRFLTFASGILGAGALMMPSLLMGNNISAEAHPRPVAAQGYGHRVS